MKRSFSRFVCVCCESVKIWSWTSCTETQGPGDSSRHPALSSRDSRAAGVRRGIKAARHCPCPPSRHWWKAHSLKRTRNPSWTGGVISEGRVPVVTQMTLFVCFWFFSATFKCSNTTCSSGVLGYLCNKVIFLRYDSPHQKSVIKIRTVSQARI